MTGTVATLVIAGAGGLGREVAGYVGDAIAAGGLRARLRGFLDDTDVDPRAFGPNLRVLGGINAYRPVGSDRVVIAVGDPAARRDIANRLAENGAIFATIIHPLAFVAVPAVLGEGCIVAPFATIGMNARLGPHCLINTHAGIGHDAELGAFSVISPHGVVNGNACLGEGVLLGSGAVVTPRRRVGSGAQVSAGSVVQSDVGDGCTVWGNPARILTKP
jgi:sugar O-acyltransferase (sialic acid O-acetyltransferase NeuD family)